MEDPEFYRQLIQRYKEKKSTDEELEVFTHLVREGKLDKYLLEQMNEDTGIPSPDGAGSSSVLTHKFGWARISAAASIALLLAAGLYFYVDRSGHEGAVTQIEGSGENKIHPGSDKAILTLADGSCIQLDETTAGALTRQEGVKILKSANGQLEYKSIPPEGSTLPEAVYNTLSTPRGGQFRVILPDGTKVWLNAESSIRYPTVFTGNERPVNITGEVYFEVKKEKDRPFRITVNGIQVEVLGTKFNVQAYDDVIKTTLAEGAVKVVNRHSKIARGYPEVSLSPGQEVIVTSAGMEVQEADLEKALAWKNGIFYFRKENLRDIMQQLARWYDFEVIYQGTVPARHYSGSIKRNAKFSEALEMLHLVSGARFEVDGKTVIVSVSE